MAFTNHKPGGSQTRPMQTTPPLKFKVDFVEPITFNKLTLSSGANWKIRILQKGSALPGLKKKERDVLREKQSKLSSTMKEIITSLPNEILQNALASTLIFAQYEAGTAVCVDETGWVLTCAHCFGESEDEWQASKKKWLLFFTGEAVQVECTVWDFKRDLSLCRIIAVESDRGPEGQVPYFKHLKLSEKAPKSRQGVFCIGQPGRDDLESTSAQKTLYNLIEVSQGKFRGMIPRVDPQDNSEIGCLKHDAWTYWGHSGAPLIKDPEMTLIGIHSSWDDQTGMRHGVPWIAIKAFLDEHLREQSTILQEGGASSTQLKPSLPDRPKPDVKKVEKNIPVIVIDDD